MNFIISAFFKHVFLPLILIEVPIWTGGIILQNRIFI